MVLVIQDTSLYDLYLFSLFIIAIILISHSKDRAPPGAPPGELSLIWFGSLHFINPYERIICV